MMVIGLFLFVFNMYKTATGPKPATEEGGEGLEGVSSRTPSTLTARA